MSKRRRVEAEENEKTGRTMVMVWHKNEGVKRFKRSHNKVNIPEGAITTRTLLQFIDEAEEKTKSKGISGVGTFLKNKLVNPKFEDVEIVGMTLAIRNGAIGTSVCIVPDVFNRKLSQKIARGRLNMKPIILPVE